MLAVPLFPPFPLVLPFLPVPFVLQLHLVLALLFGTGLGRLTKLFHGKKNRNLIEYSFLPNLRQMACQGLFCRSLMPFIFVKLLDL